VAEKCTGSSATCPANGFKASTVECRATAGECDVAEKCTGTTATCPADGFAEDGTECGDDDSSSDDDDSKEGNSGDDDDDDGGHGGDSRDDDSAERACRVATVCMDGVCSEPVVSCTPVCRSAGFWSTHGGTENRGDDVTLAVIKAASNGHLDVCGQTIYGTTSRIGRLDSALEALCVSTKGIQRRQLYRQLTATALNCVVSGKPGPDCKELVPNFTACNMLCAGLSGGGVTMSQCINELGCFNEGGRLIDGGGCALGTCKVNDTLLCGGTFGKCPDLAFVPQDCVAFPDDCHEHDLCPADFDGDGIPDLEDRFCFQSKGKDSASSPKACSSAEKNSCTIDKCP